MRVVRPDEARWAHVERALGAAGCPLAFEASSGARPDFEDARRDRLLFAIEDDAGVPVGAFCVLRRMAPAPAVGHWLLHAELHAASIPESAWSVTVDAVRRLALDARVLRLTVNVFSRAPDELKGLGTRLEQHGLVRTADVEGYAQTLIVDVSEGLDATFAGLHRSARRNVREIDRRPLTLREIDDPCWVDRMHQLSTETLARTGGHYAPVDWDARIELSQCSPGVARLVGLFHDDRNGRDALLGFAYGRWHGDHADYADSASAADVGVRVAIAYPLVWDLIRWSTELGASWFDLGGVTLGTEVDADDPLGGISDFKRFFSRDLAEVRQTWLMPPHTLRARLAQAAARMR